MALTQEQQQAIDEFVKKKFKENPDAECGIVAADASIEHVLGFDENHKPVLVHSSHIRHAKERLGIASQLAKKPRDNETKAAAKTPRVKVSRKREQKCRSKATGAAPRVAEAQPSHEAMGSDEIFTIAELLAKAEKLTPEGKTYFRWRIARLTDAG